MKDFRAHQMFCFRHVYFAALCLAWAGLRFAYGRVEDDAFITFTYARNLVEGHGFVFNAGERVLGTTAPLYGLFVALGLVFRVEPWTWALAWDVAFIAAALWMTRRWMEAAGDGRWFPLAAALLLLYSPFTCPVAGMETAPYLLCIVGVLSSLARRERPVAAVAWATGAAMIRPDGVIILGVVAWFAVRPLARERRWREVIMAASPLAALLAELVGLRLYFGAAVPNSIQAKSVISSNLRGDDLFIWAQLRFFAYFLWRPHLLGVAGLACVVAGAFRPARRPAVVFYFSYILLFMIGRAPNYFWYHTPHHWVFFPLTAAALGSAFEWAARREPRGLKPGGAPAAALIAVIVLALPTLQPLTLMTRIAFQDLHIEIEQEGYREAALYIRDSTPGGAPTIAAHEIGHLGYFSRGRVFDLEGLVTPALIEAVHNTPGIDRLSLTRAEWFVHPFEDADHPRGETEPWRAAGRHGFQPVRSISWPGGTTVVFRRGGNVPPAPPAAP